MINDSFTTFLNKQTQFFSYKIKIELLIDCKRVGGTGGGGEIEKSPSQNKYHTCH
jgi:hypothetical protein